MSELEKSETKDQLFARCIPLSHTNETWATVVFARHFERRTKAWKAEARHLLFSDLKRFHTVTHLRWVDVCNTVDFLRRFHSFSREHSRVETTVIENRTDLVASTRCATCINNVLLDVRENREVAANDRGTSEPCTR